MPILRPLSIPETPTMTALAHIELSEQYPITIRALSQSDRFRTQGMASAMTGGRWQRLSGFARAQVLHDYVGVLRRDWNDQSARAWEPGSEALQKLKQDLDSVAGADGELIAALRQEIDNTTVYDGFEAFRMKEGDARLITAEGNDIVEAYDIWFSRNSPYLILGLPTDDPAAAEEGLRRRIGYFLSRMPEGIGLEETYTARAWDYARRAYPELRKAAQGAG